MPRRSSSRIGTACAQPSFVSFARMAQRRANGGRVLADASGEHQRVETAKHGCIGARCLRHGIDKERDRRSRPRIAARLQLAHVAANAAKPEQIFAPLSLPAKFRFPEAENVIGRDRFESAVYGQKAKPVGPPG
jgi:hypothetical protein